MTRIFTVDSFTRTPFRGNPAGVCLLSGPAPEDWMRHVAAEMRLSETAFLFPKGGAWELRWFTPVKEVDLCGHATLASAHILWQEGLLGKDEAARFETRSGRLLCMRDPEGIRMDFPSYTVDEAEAPAGLFEALRSDDAPVFEASDGNLLIHMQSEATVRGLDPDYKTLYKVGGHPGYIITAESEREDVDYVCRYFAPAYGIDEDPVTGSIQCTLGPFWAKRLEKRSLQVRQVSQRGGAMQVELHRDRVHVIGHAVTILRGNLKAPPN